MKTRAHPEAQRERRVKTPSEPAPLRLLVEHVAQEHKSAVGKLDPYGELEPKSSHHQLNPAKSSPLLADRNQNGIQRPQHRPEQETQRNAQRG